MWPATSPGLAFPQQALAAADSTAPASFVHESWTVQDGLPVNSVTGILQSHDGYIWISTFDGVVRFDGVRFTVFNSSNSAGLPSNRIVSLLQTADSSLWLRTEQAQLVRFRNGEFTLFGAERGLSHGVVALHEIRGALWVGTERRMGVIRGERFVPLAPETIAATVTEILEHTDGTVWAALQPAGLVHVVEATATLFAPHEDLAAETVMALHEDRHGAVWIGTNRSVWRYDGVALDRLLIGEQVRGIRESPRTGDVWILTLTGAFRHTDGAVARVDDHPRDGVRPWILLPDLDGSMLHAAGAELYREGRRYYTPGPDDGGSGALISGAILDREGSLWLGTTARGLHRLKSSLFSVYSEPEGLALRNVYSVYEDRSGAIWAGTYGGGLSRIMGAQIARFLPQDGYPAFVNSLLQDRDGRMWLGAQDGVHICARPTMRCSRRVAEPIGHAEVFAIHEDRSGAVWVGTARGVFRSTGGIWQHLREADGAPGRRVRAFLETDDGALWMATNGGGVARYRDGRFSHVTVAEGLPSDLIRSLYQDADGWLWIGTEGRGLARLDPREWGDGRGSGSIVVYGREHGLYDGVIHQILEDDFGRLWMSTNRGIFWVWRSELNAFADGRTQTINSTAYTERDGLRNREANGGVQPAGVRAHDGRLWFPTQDGVVVVDPARIQGNRTPPNVVIEQVKAGGAALTARSAPLELSVGQRDLEIEYTALSFLAPANVRFRYRLEPYDTDWVDAGGRRTAFYTQVPPGRYTFRVLASNNDGVWNEQGAALELRLPPRFHETRTFRLLSVLALGLLLAGGVGWRIHSLRTRTRELARMVEERTRELSAHKAQLEVQAEQLQELGRAKNRFFTNVSHEFRTPLALIMGPLTDIRDGRVGDVSPEVQHQAAGALRNSRRLLRLTGQLLDLARLETGVLRLTVYRIELGALLEGLALAFTPAAERRGIRFERVLPPEPLWVYGDPQRLETVFTNLLSNAFKFTPAGGRVRVMAVVDDGAASVRVDDTGPGIAANELPRVFERFYQTETGIRQGQGSGIGLALARELVQLHGGRIEAESREGEGSAFSVSLRMGRAHLAGAPQVAALYDEPLPLETPAEDGAMTSAPPRTAAAAAATDAHSDDAEEADRPVVLIADDNAEIRAYVRSHLEAAYRVDEAADGAEALARARERVPDLIVSDLMMPGLDGVELIRALRDDPELAFVPVILLTARAELEDRLGGLNAGADDYLTKPFAAAELTARIANLIAQRQRLRDLPRAAAPVTPNGTVTAMSAPAASGGLAARLHAAAAAHLGDEEFGIDRLAAAVAMERTGLYRHMVDELGTTPSDFLRDLRLARAAELLGTGQHSVAEVAYAVGYRSVSSFSRRFRERFGCTPAAYAPAAPLES